MCLGTLIAFEGMDESGKTTHAHAFAEHLGAVYVREPHDTKDTALDIRQILTDVRDKPIDPRCEALLFAAARAQHMAEVIEPALLRGDVVISDRFVDSSIAYQGYGIQQNVEAVAQLSRFSTAGRVPDIVFYMKIDWATYTQRRSQSSKKESRFDLYGKEFYDRACLWFQHCCDWQPHKYKEIDATRPAVAVAADIEQHLLNSRLPNLAQRLR